MLEQLRNAMTHASVHGDEPSKGNEIGKRLPVKFASASHGMIKLAESVAFPVAKDAIVTHIGFWAGQVLLASGQVKPVTFKRRGVYLLEAARLDLNKD